MLNGRWEALACARNLDEACVFDYHPLVPTYLVGLIHLNWGLNPDDLMLGRPGPGHHPAVIFIQQ